MTERNETAQPAPLCQVERGVRPCAWAHRYSPRGLLHTLRDNQQDAEDDAAIVGGSAHAVALYDERALDEAVAAERERCARKPLTAQQLDKLIEAHVGGSELTDGEYSAMVMFAAAVERAHGIGA
jgi:hypothetical protein